MVYSLHVTWKQHCKITSHQVMRLVSFFLSVLEMRHQWWSIDSDSRYQLPFPTQTNSSLFPVCPSLYLCSWQLVSARGPWYCLHTVWLHGMLVLRGCPCFAFFQLIPERSYLCRVIYCRHQWAIQVLLMGRQEVAFLGCISSVEM